MIEFELRDAQRNSINIIGDQIIFNMTVIIGVKGNIYSDFLNSSNNIEISCNKSMTGYEMEIFVNDYCTEWVENNFPAI